MKNMRRQAGFTLHELLLVIALTGVVTGWASYSFVKMTDAWKQLRGQVDLDTRADEVFNAMQRDFSNVLSSRQSGAFLRGSTGVGPQGGPASDSVLVPIQTRTGSRGLLTGIAVMYRVDTARRTLMRTMGNLSEAEVAGTPQVLARGVSGFALEYAGLSEGDVWTKGWTANTLPRAVRVSMLLEDPDRPGDLISRKAVFAIHVQ